MSTIVFVFLFLFRIFKESFFHLSDSFHLKRGALFKSLSVKKSGIYRNLFKLKKCL